MVKLYENKSLENVIGSVENNNDLDFWDGHNWTNGGPGRHLGFGQLDSGEFYLIHGTQWQGEQDYAFLVSAEEIIKEAIKSDNIDQLEEYPELMHIYKEKYDKISPEKSKVFSIRVNLLESKDDINTKINDLKQKIVKYQNLKQ